MTCHRCQHALVAGRSETGIVHNCPSCGGIAVALSVLRKRCGTETIDALWSRLLERGVELQVNPLACPVCRRNTKRIHAEHSNPPVEVDLCADCQFLWLDAGELASLPVQTAARRNPVLEREAEHLRRHLRRERSQSPEWTGRDWVDPVAWLIDLLVDLLNP